MTNGLVLFGLLVAIVAGVGCGGIDGSPSLTGSTGGSSGAGGSDPGASGSAGFAGNASGGSGDAGDDRHDASSEESIPRDAGADGTIWDGLDCEGLGSRYVTMLMHAKECTFFECQMPATYCAQLVLSRLDCTCQTHINVAVNPQDLSDIAAVWKRKSCPPGSTPCQPCAAAGGVAVCGQVADAPFYGMCAP
jgi:hypothetical protein